MNISKKFFVLPIIIFFFTPLKIFPAYLNPSLPYITASLSDSANSIFFNPAGISINKSFNMFVDLGYINSRNSSIAISLDTFLGGIGFEKFEINSTKKYKIYHYVLPGNLNIFYHSIYFGIKNSWYTINKSHPYTIGIGLLSRFKNILSIGIVFDNLNKMKIYSHNSNSIETKLSVGLSLFKQHLILSFENINQKKFNLTNNIYQILFEPFKGLQTFATYFNLHNDYKFYLGAKFLFSHLAFGYYSYQGKALITPQQSYQISYSAEMYPSVLRKLRLINIKVSGLITDAEKLSFLGDVTKGAQNIIEQIDKGINDDKIKGMLLEIGTIETTSFGGIGGLTYEIREKILEFRQKGKYVVAYLENGGSTEEYYLATAADKIVFAPYASLEELGIAVKVRKFTGLLKKIGIKFDIISAGKDKNALSPFSKNLTDTQKKEIMKNVEDSYKLFIKTVSESRYINEKEINNLINKLPVLTASTLKQKNWIDKIGYKEDAIETLEFLLNKEGKGIKFINIKETFYCKNKWKDSPKIAVIPLYGPIISGKSVYNRIFGYIATGADTVIEQLENIKNDNTIEGIILRIDSPGGSVSACDRIYKKLLQIQEQGKFIVASFGSMAASGGYYIACGANKIVSTPFSITGSIGVFTMKPVLKNLFKKFDINSEIIKQGKYADLFTVDREFTDEEQKLIKKGMYEIYNRFVSIVARNRNLSEDEVKKIAEGKIYTGNIAKKLNLVDQLGGMKKAIEIIKIEKNINSPILIYFWQDYSSFSPMTLF